LGKIRNTDYKRRAKRLSAEIEEEADHLNDLLRAMDEVYEESVSFS
jgi:hypothetical protein